ncbi:MAG TPA: hypothetical protein VNQ76_02015 [Planctomicrobium sp.]|nr:hypothetical protein [Planctomicrobium sp.]
MNSESRHAPQPWICFLGMIVLLVTGCNSGPKDAPPRAIVQGEATYSGQPIDYGSIRFIPHQESGLPASEAVIRNGRYLADNKGGVPVGTHRVEILWLTPGRDDTELEKNTPVVKVPSIPTKYNIESTLELVVPPGTKTLEHHFHLE